MFDVADFTVKAINGIFCKVWPNKAVKQLQMTSLVTEFHIRQT